MQPRYSKPSHARAPAEPNPSGPGVHLDPCSPQASTADDSALSKAISRQHRGGSRWLGTSAHTEKVRPACFPMRGTVREQHVAACAAKLLSTAAQAVSDEGLICGALERQGLGLLHLRQGTHVRKHLRRQLSVDLDESDGIAAGGIAADMERSNIDSGIPQYG